MSRPDAEARTAGGEAPNASRAGEERLRMLLVEDDEGDARLVLDDLGEWLPTAAVTRVRTLAEALESLAPAAFDCVLLDLGLPDTEGIDAVARLRTHAPSAPLIVLTGLLDEAAGVAAVRAGAQDYLIKGHVAGGVLARAIRYAIGRVQAEESARELILAQAQAREAQRLERGLAPRPLVLDRSVWVASRYLPGRRRALLGGDFIDLIQTRNGLVHGVVGDVCGHGPDEAAAGVSLRAAWRALALAGADQALSTQTLQEVFEQERQLPGLFATLCSVRIDAAAGAADVLVAGHPRPLLLDGDSVRELAAPALSPAIGIGRSGWLAERVELSRSWALMLYTDGLSEAHTAGEERLGEDGVRTLLQQLLAADRQWREHPDELLGALVQRAEEGNGAPFADDVALLLVGAEEAGG